MVRFTGTKPTQATFGASGYDLHSSETIAIPPGRTCLVPTDLSLEMPNGVEAQVRPRSGLSRCGIFVQFGTIDSDYRGKIGVIVFNSTANSYTIKSGERIAQLVFGYVYDPNLVEVETLDETERGSGGFGSTGS